MFPRNRHGEDLAWERRSVGNLLQDVPSIAPLVTTILRLPILILRSMRWYRELSDFHRRVCRRAMVYKDGV